MKKYTFLLIAIVTGTMLQAQAPAVVPAPVSMQVISMDSFYITPKTAIGYTGAVLKPAAALLNMYLESLMGMQLPVTQAAGPQTGISLQVDSAAVTQKEGYNLIITVNGAVITGHDAAGVIYGIQTLRQLWQQHGKTLQLPSVTITDYPRFGYRGMHLDVSRHMFPVAFIKKYIDLLALYKLNTFHWHLTDDQGWRIEIKKYPRLQTVAAYREGTLIGHKKELPHLYDGKKYGGYYSQEEIKDVVKYAGERNVTIIPEIEMPGHALAALTAYPTLGCTGGPYKTAKFWGVFDDVFCAGNDSVFTFMQDVLDETMALFPGKYIHVGGDECPKTKWKLCPKCQARIKALNLGDEHGLQSYFVQRMEKYINSKGRNIIGWDEILEGGLAPNAVVMSWRGEEGGIAAALQGHKVIMTPESHVYFDYYQSLYPQEMMADGGYTPLSKTYSYEPIRDPVLKANAQYVLGVQGQLWSEYMPTNSIAEYMLFPRVMALAEIAWSPQEGRSYAAFLQHVRMQRPLLRQLQVHYADVFDEITFSSTQPAAGTAQVALATTLPGAQIRYTTNGTTPGAASALYTAPVNITNTGTLNAMVYYNGEPVGRMFSKHFTIHKAIGAMVTLANTPVERFNAGAQALVNGIAASNLYNDGQWLGFSGNNLEAVIDLGTQKTISSIGTHVLNYHWQRIWAPVQLTFAVSADGVQYMEVYSGNRFPVNGINTVKAIFKPVNIRYIKVTGINKGIIPANEYGEGGKAQLLMDEVVVE